MSDIIEADFDGFSLTTAPFSMTDWPYTDAPPKKIKAIDLAREHGQKIVFQSYNLPTMVVSGLINAESRVELENYIDLFKSWTRRNFGLFTVEYGSGVRQWRCAVKAFQINRAPRDLSRTPWSITFDLESPFAKDGNSDALASAQVITASIADIGINIGGTMDGQPQISFEIAAFNPIASPKTITIANPSAGQSLAITRVWAVGDVVNIDCENYLVYVNGTAFYASGQFPIFPIGAGLLQYSDDATSRNIVLTGTNERRFL
jgi:hypothetical protein